MSIILMTNMATLIEVIYKHLVVAYVKNQGWSIKILMKIMIPLIENNQ